MALTITPRAVDKNGGYRASPGSTFLTLTSIQIGASGDYSAGGIVLTPAQLNLNNVFFGIVNLRATAASGTGVDGVLDCTNPSAPKLKMNAGTAESAGAGLVNFVVDVIAFGY